MARRIKRIFNHHCDTTSRLQYNKVAHTNDTETTFARKGIALCSRKFRIYGPKYLWDSNQSYKCEELRKYNAADNSKKGVVGNKGRNMPIMPNTNVIVPKTI